MNTTCTRAIIALTKQQSVREMLPGLGVTAVAVTVAMVVHSAIGAISPLVIAVAFGAVVSNTVGVSDRIQPGVNLAARRLLRAGVVLLGFQLSLSELRALGLPGLGVVAATVAATFIGTRWAGRKLGLSNAMSLLVATGFSICGASAIAAVEGVADADDDDVVVSIALVTLFGTVAIFVLPAIGNLVGLHGIAYGNWVGASVHDIGQVVAAASPSGSAAVKAAVIVKLTRVVLLAPLVAGLSIARNRRAGGIPVTTGYRRPPIVPLFVGGFLAAIAVRTTGIMPGRALDTVKVAQTVLLAAALFGLGCGVNLARIRNVGGRPLLLGIISWALVAGVAYAGTQLLPH